MDLASVPFSRRCSTSAGLVGQAAHEQLGAVLLDQPVGQAAVVGMVVGHEDAA